MSSTCSVKRWVFFVIIASYKLSFLEFSTSDIWRRLPPVCVAVTEYAGGIKSPWFSNSKWEYVEGIPPPSPEIDSRRFKSIL